jgi:hypothetical protein
MDPSCPTTAPDCPARVETTQLGQITTAPGEWALYVDLGGIWTHVRPLVLRVRDGQRVPLRERFDLYVPHGQSWRLFAFTRECDFGLPTFSSNDRAVYPCPRSGEFGNATGDDKPGYLSIGGSPGRHSADAGAWLAEAADQVSTFTTTTEEARARWPAPNNGTLWNGSPT